MTEAECDLRRPVFDRARQSGVAPGAGIATPGVRILFRCIMFCASVVEWLKQRSHLARAPDEVAPAQGISTMFDDRRGDLGGIHRGGAPPYHG